MNVGIVVLNCQKCDQCLNHLVSLFVIVFVIVFLLVRSCLLVTLIKCLKGLSLSL